MQGDFLKLILSRFVLLAHPINVLPTNEVKTTIQNLGVVNNLRSSFLVPAKQFTNHPKKKNYPGKRPQTVRR